MKLVIGLGNPGRKYAGTRHNIGFDVLAELGHRHNAPKSKLKFEAKITEITCGTARVLLIAPQTYMNASGRSVKSAVDFYQVDLTDLLVVCDDMNLPLGRIRLRNSGSAGGQKGLKNICDHFHTDEVPRMRIGVGSPPGTMSGADFVLRPFAKADSEVVEFSIGRAADAVECWAEQGIATAMNQYNAAES